MTESESETRGSKTQFPLGVMVAVCVFLGVGTAVYVLNRQPDGGNGAGENDSGEENKALALTRTALAATENLATVEADPIWNELMALLPDDPAVAKNRALNRALRVRQLAEQALNNNFTEEEQMEARQQLPDAMLAAQESIEDYANVSGDHVLPLWLRSNIDLHQADLVPFMKRRIQMEVFDRLTAAIGGELGKQPDAIALAGPLTHVIDSTTVSAAPKNFLPDAAAASVALSEQYPENLLLAVTAAKLAIATEHPQSAALVARTGTLASAITPLLEPLTVVPMGKTPDELVQSIVTAIEDEDWKNAKSNMQRWFNILNPTELVRADRRRASPHPLDRLSFETLRRLSTEAVRGSPVAKGSAQLAFDSVPIAGDGVWTTICPIDFDLDLDDDLVAARENGTLDLWRNDGEAWSAVLSLPTDFVPTGIVTVDLFMVDETHPQRLKRYSSAARTADARPAPSGGSNSATAKDTTDFSDLYRHDTYPSLIVFGEAGVKIINVDGRQKTKDAERLSLHSDPTGLENVTEVTAVAAGDLEGDGDLDLAFATAKGLRLFANRGNRTFFEVPLANPAAGQDDPVTSLQIVDLDRDLDLDLVASHKSSGKISLVENLLHLQFRLRPLDGVPAFPDGELITVADIDANVSWDLVVGNQAQTAIVYSQTADTGVWTIERTETKSHAVAGGLVADFDNDSWSEVITSAAEQPQFSRLGTWGLDEFAAVQLEASGCSESFPVNLNSDGKVDFVGLHEGVPVAHRNRTESDGHFLQVRFKGIADNAASSGRVNHFGIGSVLELRFGPYYRAHVITGPATHFGLSEFDLASSVRVILPNGMSQTIRNPQVDTVVEEEQKLKGSCPYLYAWDGEKFVFMTDCLWAAPLGLQVARGVVAKDRPWEYLKVDGHKVKPRDGRYDFRITEELWEVAYIDRLAMTAVDHPADVEIWTNEKVGPDHLATPTTFAFRNSDLRSLQHASDTAGRDVTRTLQQQDQDFVQGFDRRLRQGLCSPHWIDLDFGELPELANQRSRPTVYMVLTGWIMPTDTSLNIQIDQNPDLPAPEFPSVWVPDPNQPDGWRKAIPFMGFPGGKTKTIVVDVTEILVADDPRLRVRTSAQIYWDSAKLAVPSQPAEHRSHELKLLAAEVAFHGFSNRQAGGPRQPEDFDYQQPIRSAIWPPLGGGLTQFGPCRELLESWDDRMVVLASGDEIRFSFAEPDAPPPDGWERDFVLHCVGWDKDADLNTLAGQSTEPLPFKGMQAYPPAPPIDGGAAPRGIDRRNRYQTFRSFWYRGGEAPPVRFSETSPGGLRDD